MSPPSLFPPFFRSLFRSSARPSVARAPMLATVAWSVIAAVVLVASPAHAVPLYILESAHGGDPRLSVFDTETGSETVIGHTGVQLMGGLAFRPGNNELYSVANETLYRIDTDTGQATVVGDIGVDFGSIGDLSFSSNGTLYLSSGRSLIEIDPDTGQGTSLGFFRGFLNGSTLAFTREPTEVVGLGVVPADTLFAWGSTTGVGSDLYTVDIETLLATPLDFPDFTAVGDEAEFSGTTWFGVSGSGFVRQVDMSAFDMTTIGRSLFTGVVGAAVPFYVPEPSTAMLVAVGLVGLASKRRTRPDSESRSEGRAPRQNT